MYVATSHSSQPFLKNVSMHVWNEYADYLLGKFVIGLLGGEDGAYVAGPDWEILLQYEHAVRKEMVKRMQLGT